MNRISLNTKQTHRDMQKSISSDLTNVSGSPVSSGDNGSSNVVRVHVRVIFLRIGEIDTLNERYQAQAAIEARWPVHFDSFARSLSRDEQQRLLDGKIVSLKNYGETHWHPQLFIENAIGEIKEQISYTARRSADQLVYICEHRDVKALLWEKLELYHFPSDVQELSISVGSMFYNDRVILVADPNRLSTINREAFIDQQEWVLYEHVDTEQRFIKEFLVNDDLDDEIQTNFQEERKRSFLVISCHAARQSAYFYWNGFCLMALITICGYCIFSIPPTLPQNRLQIAVTLLLTSITFRWTVNRSLPTISYLTSLDKYSIISIFILVILIIWHAIIGTIVFVTKNYPSVDTDNMYVWIDRYVFFSLTGAFIVMHILMFIWLLTVPLAYRRKMIRKDHEYLSRKEKNKTSRNKLLTRMPNGKTAF